MTLIQKLNDSIITNINIVESENRMCYDYNHLELAEFCEYIADDFAIGFAEWVKHQPKYKKVKKSGLDNCYIEMSSEELLEIYKKENNL